MQGNQLLKGDFTRMSRKALTDATLKALKPKKETYKLSDPAIPGLRVAVYPSGKRVFRYVYRFRGKEQLLTLGGYPAFSLAEAREAALKAKNQVERGENPAALKREMKQKPHTHTFISLANEWLALREQEWSAVHIKDTKQKLDLHIIPAIGNTPMAEISKADTKAILDRLQAQGKAATLQKVRSIISQVFRHALDLEVPGMVADWTSQLRGRQYSRPTPRHRAALIKPEEVGQLMKAIVAYEETSVITSLALRFSALTFARPGEIRHAEWNEIDFNDTLWRIPAHKMKMRQPHLVPLTFN